MEVEVVEGGGHDCGGGRRNGKGSGRERRRLIMPSVYSITNITDQIIYIYL